MTDYVNGAHTDEEFEFAIGMAAMLRTAGRAADEFGVSCRELVRRFAEQVDADQVMTALQEGLEAEVAPASTAMHGWLPDQAAVSGMLARIRLLGLELLELRRLPNSR
jgi:hypothetical protein